jgi:hypothetical protein
VSKDGLRLGVRFAGESVKDKSEYMTNGVNPAKFDLSERDHAEVQTLKANHRNWVRLFCD